MFSLHKFHTNISINYDSYESLIIKESLFPKEKFGIVKDASGIKLHLFYMKKFFSKEDMGFYKRGNVLLMEEPRKQL